MQPWNMKNAQKSHINTRKNRRNNKNILTNLYARDKLTIDLSLN